MPTRRPRSGRVAVPEATTVFTVKLPVRLAAAVREHAAGVGADDLRRGGPGAGGVPGAGPQRASAQVNDRAVETEFVFGRHAATDLSVAYAIFVPQRRARIAGRPGRKAAP